MGTANGTAMAMVLGSAFPPWSSTSPSKRRRTQEELETAVQGLLKTASELPGWSARWRGVQFAWSALRWTGALRCSVSEDICVVEKKDFPPWSLFVSCGSASPPWFVWFAWSLLSLSLLGVAHFHNLWRPIVYGGNVSPALLSWFSPPPPEANTWICHLPGWRWLMVVLEAISDGACAWGNGLASPPLPASAALPRWCEPRRLFASAARASVPCAPSVPVPDAYMHNYLKRDAKRE
jgi:hypothetical protein